MSRLFFSDYDWQDILVIIGLLGVAFILFWGVITMGRGGEYNKSKSNKIMRYRILAQGVILLFFLTILWLKTSK